jgi:uncharacterized membrane protein YdjX (TVP38/TMEM64 family)
VQSYRFAVSSLNFREYIAGTVLGTLPGIAVQVWTGTLGRAVLAGDVAPGTMALWALGLAALITATWFIGTRIRRILRDAERLLPA